jgi:hypothetical protein
MATVQGELAFKQRLKRILEDQEASEPSIPPRLQEKGVECTILMPMFEYFLGYDPINDIQYEVTSSNVYRQRFDFLLDHRFVVESKALNSPITNDEVKQISKYIAQNDEINYGMLTNGLEYVFLVQRSFIEKVANSGGAIVGASRPVYNVLTVSASDDKFRPPDIPTSRNVRFVFMRRVPTFFGSRAREGHANPPGSVHGEVQAEFGSRKHGFSFVERITQGLNG